MTPTSSRWDELNLKMFGKWTVLCPAPQALHACCKWTDCHELNPAVVCPFPPCVHMNSVVSRRWWTHKRVGMCETDGPLSLKRESYSGLWKKRRRNKTQRVSPHTREEAFVSRSTPLVFPLEMWSACCKIEEVPLADGCLSGEQSGITLPSQNW